QVSAKFINDAWGGTATTDRNLILSHLWCEPTTPSTPAPTEPAPSEPAPTEPAPVTGDVFSTTYTASSANFLNPERGFHDIYWVTNNPGHTAYTDFSKTRSKGYSLVRTHIGLDEFKNSAISTARLNEIRTAFSKAREYGVKALPIFSYTFPIDGTYGSGDAPLNIVKQHLDQLKPVFEEYGDVIVLLENGFIGPWGEWHNSSNNLDEQPALGEVYNKMLEVLPKNRMVQTRYVTQHRDLTGQKVTAATAYDQSNIARTALANMCFLADQTDMGTYSPKADVATNKAYLAEVSKYVAIGGEACSHNAGLTTNRDDCETALVELEQFHWSFINPYNGANSAVKTWQAEGCFDTISKRLGYRLELKSSAIQKEVKAGAALGVSFVVNNVGYAAPFNPRGLAVVLRNQSTGTTYTLNILQERSSTLDPRMWYRESGDITVSASPTVPSNVPAGTYDVLLSLHDPAGNLASRPEYSIRFANENVWEDASGLNLLVKGVKVTN
ncbi:MAG: DUF4832 domain-containing protein, partial [Trueperaceae bacterium]